MASITCCRHHSIINPELFEKDLPSNVPGTCPVIIAPVPRPSRLGIIFDSAEITYFLCAGSLPRREHVRVVLGWSLSKSHVRLRGHKGHRHEIPPAVFGPTRAIGSPRHYASSHPATRTDSCFSFWYQKHIVFRDLCYSPGIHIILWEAAWVYFPNE